MDRESELAVLRRLARRRIGPRLLGIFTNGRFEEFLDARALTHTEMRQADVSCQIAKRMRELHVGIEVEDFERKDEACVWRNWDRWSWKCASLVDRLDQQVDGGGKTSFLCGTGWGAFKDAVGKYRQWLESHYGGRQTIRDSLVFAHNDVRAPG